MLDYWPLDVEKPKFKQLLRPFKLLTMKSKGFFILILFTILLNQACKTSQHITEESPTLPVIPEMNLTVLPSNFTGQLDAELKKAAENGSKAVVLFFGKNRELLSYATEIAHASGMKILAGIDLAQLSEDNRSETEAKQKTLFKKEIKDIVSAYNIDGLCLKLSGNSSDLTEDLFVESMLFKPYLIASLIYSGDKDSQTAEECLSKQITDFILPQHTEMKEGYLVTIRQDDFKKKIQPEQVISLDLGSISGENKSGQSVTIMPSNRNKTTDSNGLLGFIVADTKNLVLQIAERKYAINTSDWYPPFRYRVLDDGKTTRKAPWVEFRRKPSTITDLATFDLLCKADYPSKVWINGEEVKQYKTGIFFNRVNFIEGGNRVRAIVQSDNGETVFYEQEFTFEKKDRIRKAIPLWVNERSILPDHDLELLPSDVIRFSFEASKGQEAWVEVSNEMQQKCSREDFEDYSIYKAEIPLRNLSKGKAHDVRLKLVSVGGEQTQPLIQSLKTSVWVREYSDFPMVKVARSNSRLTYNTGAPRLGGPIRAELEPGVLLKTNGRLGDNYRVSLSRTEEAIIQKNDLSILPQETIKPGYSLTSMTCSPSQDADILSIPWLEPVPYEVQAEPNQNRIVITLYGVETASTWITHRSGLKLIDKVTWQQTTPETYKVYVNLKTPNLWGYDLQQDGKRLVFRLRYPPHFDIPAQKPLTGLKIAIEAGHGGSNLGAVGLSGLLEKDINLDLSLRLGAICKLMGAEVFQVRDSDRDMGLLEKREAAIQSKADMLISIHANSGGGGYLRVSGTSTYYHNPFWAPLAEKVYSKLLELPLAEFGVVGSFNYTVTRVTQMPSILVEQAFLSHAEDEEKMADPDFRQQMAVKIYEGIVEYLKFMKEGR